MSLDLLQEFGSSLHDDTVDPWTATEGNKQRLKEDTGTDEFGDFEQPETPAQDHEQAICSVDGELLSAKANSFQEGLLVDTGISKPPPSPTPSFRELNAPLKLSIPQEEKQDTPIDKIPEQSTPVTAWPSYGRDRAKSSGKPLPLSPFAGEDDWGDFEEEIGESHVTSERIEDQAVKSQSFLPKNQVEKVPSLLDLDDHSKDVPAPASKESKPVLISMTEPPPSNIPPPSILLTVIADICKSLTEEMKNLVIAASTIMVNESLSAEKPYFEKLLVSQAILNASARILAGRKLRWKRDTHLAQSMSIGAASSGKASGMKLTGVDRTENRREDQEAAEVGRIWKEHSGGLRSQTSRINAQQSEIKLHLPEMSGTVPIRTAKAGEGGIVSLKCCFLCGLKRDERVSRLDVNVEDSFAEAGRVESPAMGLSYNIYLNGEKIFGCKNCKTHLASHDAIISRNFRGQHGKAFLFNTVVNTKQSEAVERNMTTGRHMVRDVNCKQCGDTVGWKYDKAYESSEKYKEGKFILEAELLCNVY
ncbi:MAG: hypothetical protein Q9174_002325 [Haloplaca sp. 1 TL-2023]